MKIYRYSGAGNSFVCVDGRNIDVSAFCRPGYVRMQCALNATDGFIVLVDDPESDFRMLYFNSDGSGGMMCGNGGRCVAAFAELLNIPPRGGKYAEGREYVFRAPDGLHRAQILSREGELKSVRLQMGDVSSFAEMAGGFFLDTGTRHLVLFTEDLKNVPVEVDGPRLRSSEEFAPEGTNVNWVQLTGERDLSVRTFEKGVEAETLACGTGIVASAIAASLKSGVASGPCRYEVTAASGDRLAVEFNKENSSFTEVWLTGPTLCEGDLIE